MVSHVHVHIAVCEEGLPCGQVTKDGDQGDTCAVVPLRVKHTTASPVCSNGVNVQFRHIALPSPAASPALPSTGPWQVPTCTATASLLSRSWMSDPLTLTVNGMPHAGSVGATRYSSATTANACPT